MPGNDETLTYLQKLFERRGADAYLGERVTMAEHMLQSAANVATAGGSESLIAAALLHDVGHFANDLPPKSITENTDNRHQETGANFLGACFDQAVTEPVRLHIAAKRYLCAIDPAYLHELSPASVHSLGLQGGPMSRAEIAQLETETFLEAAISVRRADDAAKLAGLQVPDFASYLPLITACEPKERFALSHAIGRQPAFGKATGRSIRNAIEQEKCFKDVGQGRTRSESGTEHLHDAVRSE